MSEFFDFLEKYNRPLTDMEQDALNSFIKRNARDILPKKKAKMKYAPGFEKGCAYNPVTDYDYNGDGYESLIELYKSSDICGQFASKKQWESVGRKIKDGAAPSLEREVYANLVEYYPYEDTVK